jgi:hypothetical protein
VSLLISTHSIPSISVQSNKFSSVTSKEKLVWCAPPASIQASSELASIQSLRIASGVVKTGLKTTSKGIEGELLRCYAMILECSSTCLNVS